MISEEEKSKQGPNIIGNEDDQEYELELGSDNGFWGEGNNVSIDTKLFIKSLTWIKLMIVIIKKIEAIHIM